MLFEEAGKEDNVGINGSLENLGDIRIVYIKFLLEMNSPASMN